MMVLVGTVYTGAKDAVSSFVYDEIASNRQATPDINGCLNTVSLSAYLPHVNASPGSSILTCR